MLHKKVKKSKQSRHLNTISRILLVSVTFFTMSVVMKGNSETIQVFQTNGIQFFAKSLYFLFLYTLLFNATRTISVRVLLLIFLSSMVGINLLGLLVERALIVLPLHSPEQFGAWSNMRSIMHVAVTGPIVEDGLQFLPLFLIHFFLKKKKRLQQCSISDWILLGSAVGLGTGLGEDLLRFSRELTNLSPTDWSWPKNVADLLWMGSQFGGRVEAFGTIHPYMGYSHAVASLIVGLAFGVRIRSTSKNGFKKMMHQALPLVALTWTMLVHSLSNFSLTDLSATLREHFLTRFLFALTGNGWIFHLLPLAALLLVWVYEDNIVSKANHAFQKNRMELLHYVMRFLKQLFTGLHFKDLRSMSEKVGATVLTLWLGMNILIESLLKRRTAIRNRNRAIWKNNYIHNGIENA